MHSWTMRRCQHLELAALGLLPGDEEDVRRLAQLWIRPPLRAAAMPSASIPSVIINIMAPRNFAGASSVHRGSRRLRQGNTCALSPWSSVTSLSSAQPVGGGGGGGGDDRNRYANSDEWNPSMYIVMGIAGLQNGMPPVELLAGEHIFFSG